MTAREAAKDHIRPYVLRGESIEQLANGGMGRYGREYSSQIGGYLCPSYGTPGPCRRIGARKIAAKLPGGDWQIFDLAELMDEIQREAAGEVIATQAVLL